MDVRNSKTFAESKIEKKLKQTTNKIKRTRKNLNIALKEAEEFKEIHQLLNKTDNDFSKYTKTETIPEVTNVTPLECSIPLTLPGIEVFKDDLIFSVFNKEICSLKHFIDSKENSVIFGIQTSALTEEYFRKIIAYHIYENFRPEKEKWASISLYVLYLLSVHQDYYFVLACFDFLKYFPFSLNPEDIFPIFINFGANLKDLFHFHQDDFLEKFNRNKNIKSVSANVEFPFFNVEMVGQVLLHYITNNFIVINSHVKTLIQGLARIALDSKVHSTSLFPLYSVLLTTVCLKVRNKFQPNQLTDWLYLENENLLNQLELCRIVSKQLFPDLHEVLVLKTISAVVKLRNYITELPITIGYFKKVLRKLRNNEMLPLELYSLFQLVNGLLPGVTATVQDSVELNKIISYIKWKVHKTQDQVDRIRLKLELAKMENLITNNTKN